MKKHSLLWCLFAFGLALLLIGCGQKGKMEPRVSITAPAEADPSLLDNLSVTLPEGVVRQSASGVQHDFLQDGKQAGGIVIMELPEALLDFPLQNMEQIAKLLRQQFFPEAPAEDTELACAGGNNHAYLEIYTGEDDLRYAHYLFRGAAVCYDVWFDLKLIPLDDAIDILATVSSDDISSERNKSPF